ncbi:flagellar protein [Sulfurimonas sp.]|uniref:tetratricopeptide repeat protein n=1 Tax=Sulfurimonas sp. TaxID=2022749 RepID=UPI00286D90D2|nr:flagellar protein [Sulfurimonas sp.]
MLKAILLIFLSLNLFALDISIQGAKENHQAYSTLHLNDKDKFLCQEFKDDFGVIIKIVCAFPKSPSQKIQKLQNSFFEIETEVKKNTFFVIIKPFEKMKLFPMVFNLTKDETLFSANVDLSNHWMIVGYKDKIPYIEKHEKSEASINFPYTATEDKFPYVGSLDIQGNPVHIKRVGDVTEYIKIKKLYEEKNYEYALELIDDVIKEYPNSLFMAELLFYKMKVYSKIEESEKLIEIAKHYLKEYSSDENVAEVLSLLAKSYNKVGLSSDADYFFDRLFSEHADSVYAKWGHIYMAESLELSGSVQKAQAIYEKIFKETDNVAVAVEAAFKLAKIHIGNSKAKKAAEYIQKIIAAKPKYFSQEMYNPSIDMMYEFLDNSDYESAAAIARVLFEHIDSSYEEYEELSKNIGIWLSKSEKKKEALVALNRYIELFPNGTYIEDVQAAKDSLFFDVNDENATTKLATYDKLMSEYSKDNIGNRAIYEKAKLLIEQSMFAKALNMEPELLKLDSAEYSDIPKLITDAAIGVVKQSLKEKECNKVLSVSSKYKIELSAEWDDGIYECAMKGANFPLAKKIADRNLKSKDLEQRKKWLYRYIKVDFATGNYSNVIEASKELISLIESDKNSAYKDVYRYIFDTYHRLENTPKMIESINTVVKVYQNDYLDIDRYVAVMAVGSNKKDNNLVIEYGEKVMNIQKTSASRPQSPFVEFTLYQAYIEKENYNKALDAIKLLNSFELNKNQRARQKYLLGSVLEKLWKDEEASKAYQEAINADPASAWAKLAKSAKGL